MLETLQAGLVKTPNGCGHHCPLYSLVFQPLYLAVNPHNHFLLSTRQDTMTSLLCPLHATQSDNMTS